MKTTTRGRTSAQPYRYDNQKKRLMPEITIIAAVAQNRAIGYRNSLIYRLSADLKHFRLLTTGHTVLMGRKTFESLPKGALPNRRNIVVSRTVKEFEGCDVYASMREALENCGNNEKVFIIGGASVYAEACGVAERLELTYVHDTPANADVFFPEINLDEWQETGREKHEADEKNEKPFDFVSYRRKH